MGDILVKTITESQGKAMHDYKSVYVCKRNESILGKKAKELSSFLWDSNPSYRAGTNNIKAASRLAKGNAINKRTSWKKTTTPVYRQCTVVMSSLIHILNKNCYLQ